MPSASGSLRSQAAHYGRRRFEQAAAPSATAPRSISKRITLPQQSNAAHHAPAGPCAVDDIRRVAGRVHALVRLRPSLARLPPPASSDAMSDQRHAPATSLRRGRVVHHGWQRCEKTAAPSATPAPSISKGLYRPSNLTPGITRRPEPLIEDDKQRVGGRVHAVVRWQGFLLLPYALHVRPNVHL
jgi:hypothetical protein